MLKFAFMSRKRIKYNWLFIINDFGLVEEFDDYKAHNDLKHHLKGKKSLSLNRLARAFVHKQLWNHRDIYTCPCYQVGQEQPYREYILRNV